MADKSITAAASAKLKEKFDLNKYNTKKGLQGNIAYKPQTYLPLSPALCEELTIPGIPLGQITLLRGHSDTGKTTALLETAVAAQKAGIMPVFIITEMKWSWEHVELMGFELNNPEKPYLYIDRESLDTIEDVAAFIMGTINDQEKGDLPFDLMFLWDSIGSIPCKQSVDSKNNNNQWNALALQTQFGNFVNQKIVMSRKASKPYTNTLVCVNQVWNTIPENAFSASKMMNKGGNAMWLAAALVITFGNISNSGTSKINAQKDGKKVEYAKRTNVQVDKDHIKGLTSKGTVLTTAHGFIKNDKKAIEEYKKTSAERWIEILGGVDFKLIEEEVESEPIEYFREEDNG